MPKENSVSCVTGKVGAGKEASLMVVVDHGGGRVTLWLEPGLPRDTIVAFYRIYERGVTPEESWEVFQEGQSVASYADGEGAELGAIELLPGAHYTIDARIFTGDRTIELPSIAVELQVEPMDQSSIATRDAFNDAFKQLFQKFFQQSQTEDDLRGFFDSFSADQLDLLFSAVIELGGPMDHCDDDYDEIIGFFDFIDYITAVAHSCGEAAMEILQNYPDSPSNRHYIHFIRKYLGDERFYAPILESYPYCSR
jgi:hypothetical protein